MSAPQQSSKGPAIDGASEDPSDRSAASADSVTPPPVSVAAPSSLVTRTPTISEGANDAILGAGKGVLHVATQDVLFIESTEARCDVCGDIVAEDDELDHASNDYAVSGRGLYVWSRSGETRYEEPPLCPACASAVGVSAMARWEIEEEEG